jgi:hypothetical protein
LAVIALGCLWGLIEGTSGLVLRGGCAGMYSGSILTGTSLLFFSASYALVGRLLPLLALPVVASLFRIYAGLLCGRSPISGAVANPMYAFFGVAVAFGVMMVLFRPLERRASSIHGAAAGAVTAMFAVNLFLPVRWITGVPACTAANSDVPMALHGLPVAMLIAAITMPLGLWAGAWLRPRLAEPIPLRDRIVSGVSVALSACSLLIVTVLHVR